eukprot:scaffold86558_cov63-Phaeocystis_antarctica.AAC.2
MSHGRHMPEDGPAVAHLARQRVQAVESRVIADPADELKGAATRRHRSLSPHNLLSLPQTHRKEGATDRHAVGARGAAEAERLGLDPSVADARPCVGIDMQRHAQGAEADLEPPQLGLEECADPPPPQQQAGGGGRPLQAT